MSYKKGVLINLDRERLLIITARDAKEIHGTSVDESTDWLSQFIHFLFVGLRHDDPELTEEALWDLVDMSQMDYYRQKFSEAMGNKPEGVKDDVTLPLANSDQTSKS